MPILLFRAQLATLMDAPCLGPVQPPSTTDVPGMDLPEQCELHRAVTILLDIGARYL